MHIAFLDAGSVGEDVSLESLRGCGILHTYHNSTEEILFERLVGIDVVVTNKVIFTRSVIERLPKLKLICVLATGTNTIDLQAARDRGVAVSNVAGYSTDVVAQHTFAMLFYVLEHLPHYDSYVKTGEYAHNTFLSHFTPFFWEIAGKTWGIIGLGKIGRRIASIARSFGCRVIYTSLSKIAREEEVERVSLEDLLIHSDIVSLHAPYSKETENLINMKRLEMMRPHAILINVGRGGVVDEKALAHALDEGIIAGAGLDVLSAEPIVLSNPLLHMRHPERILITPHMAWGSVEARQRVVDQTALNIQAFTMGQERNRVDLQKKSD